jgi:uncharacterized membrane protein YuzA (DUF378 family)
MTPLDWVSWGLSTIGALNWGFTGVGQFNLVDQLFGHDTAASRIVYGLVGLAGVWSIYRLVEQNRSVNAETPITRIFTGRP